MSERKNKDPLHGMTLKTILEELVERYGWEEMSSRISINCFAVNPSLKSSLTFLRKTPWARNKVENLYLTTHGHPIPVRKKVEAPAETKAPSRGRSDSRPARRPAKKPDGINVWTGKPFGEED